MIVGLILHCAVKGNSNLMFSVFSERNQLTEVTIWSKLDDCVGERVIDGHDRDVYIN